MTDGCQSGYSYHPCVSTYPTPSRFHGRDRLRKTVLIGGQCGGANKGGALGVGAVSKQGGHRCVPIRTSTAPEKVERGGLPIGVKSGLVVTHVLLVSDMST